MEGHQHRFGRLVAIRRRHVVTYPVPTPIYRLVHVDNLDTLLSRNALHAPNFTPEDGLPYRTIRAYPVVTHTHYI